VKQNGADEVVMSCELVDAGACLEAEDIYAIVVARQRKALLT
jgi:hypothetical protein